jgi:SNF2 family DNA or RNA helicase
MKNLFDFLVPGYLGSDEYFRKNFMQPIEKGAEPETELALQKLIHPFKLRRNKANVLHDLPEKVEDIRHCTLAPDQVKLYREILELKARPILETLKDESSPVPYLHVFAVLTLLKQVCNHPLLVHPGKLTQYESGKFEVLKELLTEALDSGHKIVIYSQYVEMIRIISEYLKSSSIGHSVLTGQTKNRGRVIETFQTDPNCKVFIGSLLAGGIGIDLTAASVVIHYDRWWNASKENQATDRVYRIGQNKNVQVLKLVTRGTLEEKIDALIATKRELFEKFMDRDEELFKTFSRSQLIELLQ